MDYLWIKAFHVISVISWVTGLLFLSYLFVSHVSVIKEDATAIFKRMEKQLYYILMIPAMVASLLFGLWMIYLRPAILMDPWLHAKLGLVAVLIVFHHMLGHWGKALAQEKNRHSDRFFRRITVLVILLLIGIILFVTIKPDLRS